MATATKPTSAQAARRAASLWEHFDPMANDPANDRRWEELKGLADEHPDLRESIETGDIPTLLDRHHNQRTRSKTSARQQTSPSGTRAQRNARQAAERGAKSAQGRGGPTPGGPSGGPARRQGPPAGSRQPARRGAGRGRSVFGITPGRALEQTGVPGGVRSTAQLVLEAGGLVVGLSLAYLLLTNAQTAGRGKAAIELVAGFVQTALAVFINPVDPLTTLKIGNPTSTSSSSSSDPASSDPGGQSGSGTQAVPAAGTLLTQVERQAGITPGGLSFPPLTATPRTPSTRPSETKKATPDVNPFGGGRPVVKPPVRQPAIPTYKK